MKYLFKQDVVDAYPDGWSCVGCGISFNEKTIDVNCLYVIETEEGTKCLDCSNTSKQMNQIKVLFAKIDRLENKKTKASKLGSMTVEQTKKYKEEIIETKENLSELIDDIDEIINSKIGIFKEKTNKGGK